MSRPSITEYHRAASLEDAWGYIAAGAPHVRLLSGGADLTIHAPPEVTTLVDVGRVLDASIGVASDGAIEIGAMATLTAVLEDPLLAGFAGGVIPEMMVHVGNPLLRNFSSIGGHLARGYLSDVVPVFLALDATVTYYRDGQTVSLPLADYYSGSHNSRPHILTSVGIPPDRPRSVAAFQRFARTSFDFPILNACCRVELDDNGGVAGCRIVCGATPGRSKRASAAETELQSRGLTEEGIAAAARSAREEVETRSTWVASAEYRSHLVEVLVGRCLGTVAGRLGVAP